MSLDPKYLIDRQMETQFIAVQEGQLAIKFVGVPCGAVQISSVDLAAAIDAWLKAPRTYQPITEESFDGGKSKPYVMDEIGLYPQTESEFKRWDRVLTAKNEPEDEHPNNALGH